MECQVRELYFGDVNGYLRLKMICYKLCKNETFSLLCDQTSNEIIFKKVDYSQLLVIILMIQWFNLGFNDSILGLIDSILGFNDSILGFNDSILGFNDSILGFNDSI